MPDFNFSTRAPSWDGAAGSSNRGGAATFSVISRSCTTKRTATHRRTVPGTGLAAWGDVRRALLQIAEVAMTARILIIDDDGPQRRSLRLGLELAGFAAAEAATARETLATVDCTRIDFAIVDAHIDGEEGLELARRLRFRHPQLPLVVTSSSRLSREQTASLTPNVLAFVPKPYNLNELSAFLHRVLDRTAAVG
jgi:CheY-like chemotaxis protein